MDREKLFNNILTYEYEKDNDELGMILSNNIDMTFNDGAAISGKAFDGLIEDIKKWRTIKNHRMGL